MTFWRQHLHRCGYLWLAAILMGVVMTGCTTVGVDYRTPTTAVPDAWTQSVRPHLDNRGECLAEWWRGFNDPTLDQLIERVRNENPDFELAVQRIVEARAQRKAAIGGLFPALGADSGYLRSGRSDNLISAPTPQPFDIYSVGASGSWEIDLFGGVRRSVESADAKFEASVESYRDVLVSLFADVATNYIDYRTFQERIRVANQNIAIQEESLDLAQKRFDAGLVSKIDLTQARANLETTRATVPQLRGQLAAAKNRIASLTGGYPHSVTALLRRSHSIPIPKKDFSVGKPADLLRTRPDVRQAERNLAAAVAEIGIAESELYPKFSLVGNLSLEALDVSDIVDASSATYGFGPSIRWNLFSSGRIKNQIRAEEAQAMQAYAAYEKVVLRAVEDVETSMAAVATERERLASLRRAVSASAASVDLVKTNYKEGLVDFQRVIDTERVLFQAEDLAVTSRGQIARNYVGLYRALGGGAALEEVDLPATKKRPGGGFLIKREAPYADTPQRDAEEAVESEGS